MMNVRYKRNIMAAVRQLVLVRGQPGRYTHPLSSAYTPFVAPPYAHVPA